MLEENKGLELFFQGAVVNAIREPKSVLSPRVEQHKAKDVTNEVYLVPNMRNGKIIGWVNLFGSEVK